MAQDTLPPCFSTLFAKMERRFLVSLRVLSQFRWFLKTFINVIKGQYYVQNTEFEAFFRTCMVRKNRLRKRVSVYSLRNAWEGGWEKWGRWDFTSTRWHFQKFRIQVVNCANSLPLRNNASFVPGAFRYIMYRLVFQVFTPHTRVMGRFLDGYDFINVPWAMAISIPNSFHK